MSKEMPESASHSNFKSVSEAGLDYSCYPMYLFEKSKRLGVWNPSEIDLTQDAFDWGNFSDAQKRSFLRLTCMFQAGEESVALDLLPLIDVVASEGRVEEELYLASFLFEEAKHVDAFRRWLDFVVGKREFEHLFTPSYRKIFYNELPGAMRRLMHDRSAEAQARAVTTYNIIVEGVLAETGYYSYYRVIDNLHVMPGMRKIVQYVKRDEARHIAFGIYLLSRLGAENGDVVWKAIDSQLDLLMPLALSLVNETFDAMGSSPPFEMSLDEFATFAMNQFQKRTAALERTKEMSLYDILHMHSRNLALDEE